MINSLFERVRSLHKRYKNKKAFFARVIEAASDGKLSAEEMTELRNAMSELGLTEREFQRIRASAYANALTAAGADGEVTEDEEKELERLQRFLRIPDNELSSSKATLLRLRMISDARRGILPIISDPNIVLQRGEQAHWRAVASLLEERVVRRRYEGGSQGVSIRIAKGVSWRVGAHRGHIVSDKAIVPVSRGDFVVTDKRVVFSGDRKSFSIKYEKLLDADMYSDGIRLTNSSGKPYTLQFMSSDCADVIRAVLNQAVKNALA